MTDAQQKKIVELLEKGHTQQEIVRETGLSRGSVYRVIKTYRDSLNASKSKLDDFEDEQNSDADSVENSMPDDDDLPPGDFTDDSNEIKEQQTNMSPLSEEPMASIPESGFLKSIELLGQLNRELMQNSMGNFDKAVRAMEEMLERFQMYDSAGLRSAVEEVNALIEPLHAVSRNEQNNLPLRTAVFFIVLLLFLLTGFIFGLGSYSLFARYTFGILLAINGILLVLLFVIRKWQSNDWFAWIAANSVLAPVSLFTGYYLGLMDWLVLENWLLTFLLFPVGCLIALPFAIWRRNK